MSWRKNENLSVAFSLVSDAVFFCNASAATAEKIIVEAFGSGVTKIEALQNAWAVATREAVGLYMNARNELKSDSLDAHYTEQVASYSRGQVDYFTILSEKRENGLWNIKIKANVDRDVLQETVAEATGRTVHIDGASLTAQIQKFPVSFTGASDVLFVTPFITIGLASNIAPNGTRPCSMFIYDLHFHIPVSELVETKDLASAYTVEPYARPE